MVLGRLQVCSGFRAGWDFPKIPAGGGVLSAGRPAGILAKKATPNALGTSVALDDSQCKEFTEINGRGT
jgi:hypothetical protein